MINVRVIAGATLVAGAVFTSGPADAACQPFGTAAMVCADLGVHTGILSGSIGADSAQAVCFPASNCTYIGRSGAFYNYGAGGACVMVLGSKTGAC